MREIKFRAWDRKQKSMFPIHILEWNKISDGLTFLKGADIHDKDSDNSGDIVYGGQANKMTGNPLQRRYELMQHIKHFELDCFEGDFIAIACDCDSEYGCSHGPGIYLVEWSEEFAGFALNNIRSGRKDNFEDFGVENMHVAGNIYENPELLK